MDVLFTVKELIGTLEKEIENNKCELEELPEGTLGYLYENGKTRLFYRCRGKRRTINSNVDMLKKLGRKRVLCDQIKTDRENLRLLITLRNHLRDTSPYKLIRKMPQAYQHLHESYFLKPPQLSAWSNAPYNQSCKYTERKTHQTSFGLFVRSKSEQLIAELLYKYGTEFRYEEVVVINGIEYAPDFSIRLKNGKIIYWEHFGMMTQHGYVNSFYNKLNAYRNGGIIPGVNLIATYDDENGNLSTTVVEGIIKGMLT